MGRLDEIASEQISRWDEQGRGWQVWSEPVFPEPPFQPFRGFRLPPTNPQADDGRKPGLVASLFDHIHNRLNPKPPGLAEPDEEEEAIEPRAVEPSSLVELQVALPKNFDAPRHEFESFLQAVCGRSPLCFELLGSPDQILTQLVVDATDATRVREQMEVRFPDAVLSVQEGALKSTWDACGEGDSIIVEFGLARSFAFPLAACKADPFVGVTAALQQVAGGELGLLQVLFEPARQPWGEGLINALTDGDARPIFQNAPEWLRAAEEMRAKRLYAGVVRIATRAAGFDRALDLARNLASALSVFAHPTSNELIPLHNDGYPADTHEEDVLCRQTRRSGMILSSDELLGFVHLPSSEVHTPKLVRQVGRTKPAPRSLQAGSGLLLGHNLHAGRSVEVRLSPDQRVRHTHVLGVHGTGKSTLLLNLICQDIEQGQGIAVLDPHGDLIDRVLDCIPENRIDDVILFDAADEEYSIPFNILSAHSDLEKNLLASDLVSVFERLSTSWGDQMASVLRNAILAFLESSQGGTLEDLRRFLLDTRFREQFLETVGDPSVVFFWRKAFTQLTGNRSVGPVVTRLDEFLSPKTIRYMVSQPVNRLDFSEIMDTGKILLARLSQGQIGKENAFLLGSLLVTKFQQTTMSRQAKAVAERRDFALIADEFQHFITPSMTEIITGARKYRLGLVLAHQELQQLERDRELASAVSHCCTRVVFRVGDDDARKLADGFASFDARDLQNLPVGHAICRVERSDQDFNLTVPLPKPPDPGLAADVRRQVVTRSREKYARPRGEVEAKLRERFKDVPKPARGASPTKADVTPPPQPKPAPKPAPPPEPKAAPKPASPFVTEAKPTRGRGIGGHQHNLIRERIETAARQLGYSTSREHKLEQDEKVDVVLEKPERAIACEIGISTTIDHEVGNAAKCVRAGFQVVALISIQEERLEKTRQAVCSSLPPEEAARVNYYTPDQFIAHLKELAKHDAVAPPPAKPGKSTYGKWKVSTKKASLTPDEQQQKEDTIYRAIAETMREAKNK